MRKTEVAADAAAESLGLSRRGAITALLPAFATYALLGQAQAQSRTSPALWITRQDEIARALMAGEIAPLTWQTEVERLAAEVDLVELMTAVARARVTAAPRGASNDPAKRYVRFLDETGAPRQLAYGAAFFDFEPQNVITPHGHKHMASAHMVVEGAFRVRNFDRLRDEGEAMVIRHTRDYVARTGEISTMSSQRDNIHWFVPQGGRATTFDVIVSGIDPGEDDYEIRAIDPIGGRHLPDGSIVAPIMEFGEASRRYTADV